MSEKRPLTATELEAMRAEYARAHREKYRDEPTNSLLAPLVERIYAILRRQGLLK